MILMKEKNLKYTEETPSGSAVTTTFTAVDISEITLIRTGYKG